MRIRNSAAWMAGIAGMALVLSACGGNASTETEPTGAKTPASSEAETDGGEAALGEAAAAAAGEPMELPSITIGYVNYVGANLEAAREELGSKEASEALGWEFISCDGQGIPAVMAKCATNLVNQDVDALFVNGFPQAVFTEALDIAEDKEIPVISVGGDGGPKDRLAGSFYPNEADMGTELAEWMIDKLGADSGAEIIVQDFPAEFIIARNDAMKAALEETSITIGATFDADPANLIDGTKAQSTAMLNSAPDAKALWIPFSSSDAGAAQALATKYPGKSFPDRPLLVTVYASLPTLDRIRQGSVDAAVENSSGWASWVAMDQLAESLVRGTEISQESTPDYGEGLDFFRPQVVDSTNLPPEGELLAPPADYMEFFNAKWNAEFTNLG
jgi:ribose transport system substrate-binding protein